MDTIERYREIVKQALTDQAQYSTCEPGVEAQLIFDETHDHYQLNYVGWHDRRRVFGPIMHFDIRGGKIWIQYNGTEEAIAQKLMSMGVPNSDIVLGFHSEFKRQFTQYAVS